MDILVIGVDVEEFTDAISEFGEDVKSGTECVALECSCYPVIVKLDLGWDVPRKGNA